MKLEATTPMRLVGRRDPVLHQPAQPVDSLDQSTGRVLDEMASFMRQSGGCGLAGPQVGIPYRLIVVDAGGGLVKAANPEIVARSGGVPSLEGCLSLSGTMSLVWRSSQVTVKGTDEKGQPFLRQCRGLESRCFQHEIDHLDGKLMTDRTLVSITPLRLLGGAGGAIAGGLMRGVPGAIIGGAAGLGLAWGAEKAFGF